MKQSVSYIVGAKRQASGRGGVGEFTPIRAVHSLCSGLLVRNTFSRFINMENENDSDFAAQTEGSKCVFIESVIRKPRTARKTTVHFILFGQSVHIYSPSNLGKFSALAEEKEQEQEEAEVLEQPTMPKSKSTEELALFLSSFIISSAATPATVLEDDTDTDLDIDLDLEDEEECDCLDCQELNDVSPIDSRKNSPYPWWWTDDL